MNRDEASEGARRQLRCLSPSLSFFCQFCPPIIVAKLSGELSLPCCEPSQRALYGISLPDKIPNLLEVPLCLIDRSIKKDAIYQQLIKHFKSSVCHFAAREFVFAVPN